MCKQALTKIRLGLSISIILIFSTLWSIGQPNAVQSETKLPGVGDAAPSLSAAEWLKGGPVNLKDGKIHVVEFWATWCGPCKASMPELSQLARHYKGKVEIVGMDVLENIHSSNKNADFKPKVKAFVDRSKNMMSYTVGMDNLAGDICASWIGRQAGIPQSFVVDRNGKIIWKGHPQAGLAEVIELAVHDKATKEALDQVQKKAAESIKVLSSIYGEARKAQEAKDWAKVVEAMEKIEKRPPPFPGAQPHGVAEFGSMKYDALLHLDPAKAKLYADKYFNLFKDNPLAIGVFAYRALTNQDSTIKPDYKTIIEFLQHSTSLLYEAFSTQALADAYFSSGNPQRAAEVKKEEIEKLKADTTNPPTSESLEKAMEILAKYEKAAAEKK